MEKIPLPREWMPAPPKPNMREMIEKINESCPHDVKYNLLEERKLVDVLRNNKADGLWTHYRHMNYDTFISMMKLEYQCHLNSAISLMKCMAKYGIVKRNVELVLLDQTKKLRMWKHWECWLMGKLDFRYWHCDCHYQVPYGKVIMGGCRKHD
jgi:hypothetical protein